MFGVDYSELLLVGLVALVVIGPKDLPKAMRVMGYWVGKARAIGRQFRAGFDEMVREAELAEMEKKWTAENDRIMREFSGHDQPAPAQLTEEMPASDAPVIVEQPQVLPAPAPAEAAPEQPSLFGDTPAAEPKAQS